MIGAFDNYFKGNPPFSERKCRKDIPDALVIEGLKRVLSSDSTVVFVCDDGNLRASGERLGAIVVETVPDALRHELISILHSNSDFALWWERNYLKVVIDLKSEQDKVFKILSDIAIGLVDGSWIRHYSIPDDNHEAFVLDSGEIKVDRTLWDEAESLGEGLLSIPFVFTIALNLETSVYKGDYSEIPNWIKVSVGDFETGHYF